MKNFKSTVFIALMMVSSGIIAQQAITKFSMNTSKTSDTISKHIYGHFSEHLGHCIYGGIWVGEKSSIPNIRGIRTDVVEALKNINIPNLRWPGGCFADEYHWMDGIGPKESRPKMVNTNWGGVTEDNSFGTHEFMDLCEQLHCEPVICGNVGSGTVEEMSNWAEYLTSSSINPMSDLRKKNGRQEPWKVKFWGVGNESWGCGGIMTADFYANEMAKYSFFLKNQGNNVLYKIASGGLESDYNWTETLMKKRSQVDGWLKSFINGYSLHYYTVVDWNKKGSATLFGEEEWFNNLSKTYRMEELVTKHSEVMDKYDPEKQVGLVVDEWGAWYDVEPGTNPGFLFQQNSLRDAMLAAINLNIFNNHCDRVKMANIAQVINVLQSVILTKDEKMILTPTYYVFEMYKVHHDAALIPINFESPKYEYKGKQIAAVTASASKNKAGVVHITFSNIDPNKSQEISIELDNDNMKSVTGKILTADDMTAHNTFENPNVIKSKDFSGAKLTKNVISVILPAKSVVMLEVK
jgi:alpha-L-arabinofuranosidase